MLRLGAAGSRGGRRAVEVDMIAVLFCCNVIVLLDCLLLACLYSVFGKIEK